LVASVTSPPRWPAPSSFKLPPSRICSRLGVLAECGWQAEGPLLIFRLPPRSSLTGARLHIDGKVLGRTRKQMFTVVAIGAWITTTASQAGPNPRQNKDHQKNYPGRDERRTHVGSQEMGQPSTTGALLAEFAQEELGAALAPGLIRHLPGLASREPRTASRRLCAGEPEGGGQALSLPPPHPPGHRLLRHTEPLHERRLAWHRLASLEDAPSRRRVRWPRSTPPCGMPARRAIG
jgi:hypothetical protein